MTVATNALLEGRGARTAFVATEGFTDIIALGRQSRAELYRLCAARPAPLTPHEGRVRRAGADDPDGPLRALDRRRRGRAGAGDRRLRARGGGRRAAARLPPPRARAGARRGPARAAPRRPRVALPPGRGDVPEFERAATTEIDAALSPLLAGYLRRLVERCARGRPARAVDHAVKRRADRPRRRPPSTPPGRSSRARRAGAAGAAYVARAAGSPDALCFDMGGTSCDVCVVDGGAVQEQSAGRRSPGARSRCRWSPCTPSAPAAGRSRGAIPAARCASGRARRGPIPARRATGEAAASRRSPTPTSCSAISRPTRRLPAAWSSTPTRPRTAIAGLAERARPRADASAPRASSASPTPRWSARCGSSPSSGASTRAATRCWPSAEPGALHAAAIAAELGITEIICPRASGVLAAARPGRLPAPARRPAQRLSRRRRADRARRSPTLVDELGEQARAELGRARGGAEGELRAALPRAGVRAGRRRGAARRARRSARGVRGDP